MPQSTNARKLIFIRKFTLSRKTICFQSKQESVAGNLLFSLQMNIHSSSWREIERAREREEEENCLPRLNFEKIFSLRSTVTNHETSIWFIWKVHSNDFRLQSKIFVKLFENNLTQIRVMSEQRTSRAWVLGMRNSSYGMVYRSVRMHATDANDLLICWRSEIYQVHHPKAIEFLWSEHTKSCVIFAHIHTRALINLLAWPGFPVTSTNASTTVRNLLTLIHSLRTSSN